MSSFLVLLVAAATTLSAVNAIVLQSQFFYDSGCLQPAFYQSYGLYICMPNSGGSIKSIQASSQTSGEVQTTKYFYSDENCKTPVKSETYAYKTKCTTNGGSYYYKSAFVGGIVPNSPGAATIGYASTDNSCSNPTYSVWYPAGCQSYTDGGNNYYSQLACEDGTYTQYLFTDSSCTKKANGTGASDSHPGCAAASGTAYYNQKYLETVCTTKTSSLTTSCFGGSETVQLENGETKAIKSVVVGDRILSASETGALSFSDVIFVPHAKNFDPATFVVLYTNSGKDLTVTADHLLMAGVCDQQAMKLMMASEVAVGMCVRTVSGDEEVVSLTQQEGFGKYSVVTREQFIVVNGIVASPFATNHAVANAFYNVLRAVVAVAPSSLLQASWMREMVTTIGDLSVSVVGA